jgi:hypothetical protein
MANLHYQGLGCTALLALELALTIVTVRVIENACKHFIKNYGVKNVSLYLFQNILCGLANKTLQKSVTTTLEPNELTNGNFERGFLNRCS